MNPRWRRNEVAHRALLIDGILHSHVRLKEMSHGKSLPALVEEWQQPTDPRLKETHRIQKQLGYASGRFRPHPSSSSTVASRSYKPPKALAPADLAEQDSPSARKALLNYTSPGGFYRKARPVFVGSNA